MGWCGGFGGSSWGFGSRSPAIVREGPVGLRHSVSVLAFLDSVPPIIRRVEQLRGEPLGHGLFVALACRGNDPADPQCLTARGTHFNGHLIRGAADAA